MKSVLLMDIAIACVGIYLAVVAVYMKKTGKISPLVLSGNEIGKCRKTAEYLKDIIPPMFLFGVVAAATGVFAVLCDTGVIAVGRIWGLMELFVFLIALAGFSHQMKTAKKKIFSLKRLTKK